MQSSANVLQLSRRNYHSQLTYSQAGSQMTLDGLDRRKICDTVSTGRRSFFPVRLCFAIISCIVQTTFVSSTREAPTKTLFNFRNWRQAWNAAGVMSQSGQRVCYVTFSRRLLENIKFSLVVRSSSIWYNITTISGAYENISEISSCIFSDVIYLPIPHQDAR